MKKTLFLIIAILCMTAIGASAQTTPAVRWRTTVKMTSPTQGILTVRALVTPGWHLYSTSLPKGGPRPTILDFSASTGVKFLGDFKPSQKPESSLDKMFNLKLSYWSSNVTFTRNFRLTDPANAVINGKITFMACNGNTCNPPKTESVRVPVPAYKKAAARP